MDPTPEMRRLRHRIAYLEHQVQELKDLLNDQHGPVAYRKFNSIDYEFVDAIYVEVENNSGDPTLYAGWEPLYTRVEKQVVM